MDKMRTVLLCVIVGLLLFGCGRHEAGIVGEWRGTDNIPAIPGAMSAVSEPATVTFKAGGSATVTVSNYIGTITSEFTYQESGGSITLTPKPSSAAPNAFLAGLMSPVTYTCALSGNSLSLVEPKTGANFSLNRT